MPVTVQICSLLSPAFMALVINAPHTEPGDAPKWTIEPFLLSMAFGCSSATVLTMPAVQTLERMRDEEPKKAGSTGLSYALLSGDFYSGQNLLSVSDSAPGEGAGPVPRDSDPVSRVRN